MSNPHRAIISEIRSVTLSTMDVLSGMFTMGRGDFCCLKYMYDGSTIPLAWLALNRLLLHTDVVIRQGGWICATTKKYINNSLAKQIMLLY